MYKGVKISSGGYKSIVANTNLNRVYLLIVGTNILLKGHIMKMDIKVDRCYAIFSGCLKAYGLGWERL